MPISLRDIVRWLVAGTVLGFGLFIGSRVATALEPSPAPQTQAAASSEASVPASCDQTQAAAAPAPAPSAAPAAPQGDSVTADPDDDDDDDDDGPSLAERVARIRAERERDTAGAGASSGANAADLGAPGTVAALQAGNGAAVTVEGDTETDIDQTADALSGDAVAGGQVMGIAASAGGAGGSALSRTAGIDVENDSNDAAASSGDANAANTATVSAPVVAGDLSVVNSVVQGPVNRTITVDGDVEIKIKQESVATSGDALAGSQVLGVSGGGVGAGPCGTTLVARNRSEDANASSGDANASNLATITAPLLAGGISVENSTVQGPVSSIVNVTGDVEVKVKQKAIARSGSALAGSQIVGAATGDCASRGAGGGIAVDASNASRSAGATSGQADAANEAVAGTGVPLNGVLAVSRTPAGGTGSTMIFALAAAGGLGVGAAAGRRRRRSP